MKLKDNIENSIFYLQYFFSFTSNFKNPLITRADPAQNLTGSNGNPKNFDRRKAARKIFRPATGVRGHAPPEKFENATSHMG